MAGGARLAEAEVCNDRACATTQLLVRGDKVSFVSVEQAKKVGCSTGLCPMALSDAKMPADVKIPKPYVLVHDVLGELLDRCELYVVRWRGGARRMSNSHPEAQQVAEDYYGATTQVSVGSVEIPRGSWTRVAKVRFIRYTRASSPDVRRPRDYEHEYDPPVWLSVCRSPTLAWKISLPSGCIVDSRGFVRP